MKEVIRFILMVIVLYIAFMALWLSFSQLQGAEKAYNENKNQDLSEYCHIASIDILNVILGNQKAYIYVSNSGQVQLDITNSALVLDNVTYFSSEMPKTVGAGQPDRIAFENVTYNACPSSFSIATVDTPCPGVKDVFRGTASCE